MSVHVSIHDVSPAWQAEVEQALRICELKGARPALLVVPDYHGRSALPDDAAFCGRLRALQDRGHEVFLHGFHHHAGSRPPRSTPTERVRWLVAQRLWSSDEAELSSLTQEQGRERLARGERLLRDVGLRVDGYVAPAWSMPRWLLPLLARRGIRYTEDRTRIYDPFTGHSRASVVLNWATRSRLRLLSSAGWCRAARAAGALLPIRVAIHPADMRVPFVVREIERTLGWASGDFVASSFELLHGAR